MKRATQWPMQSPLVRWHVRHVCVIWVVVRVLVTMALASAGNMPGELPVPLPVMVAGASATLTSLLISIALAAIDRRRIGAPLLFANLGYSAWWLVGTSSVIVVAGELLMRLVLSATSVGTP